eukprot:TRINITY_DN3752_c0_g2_i6.p1 TRINITY_DN3752_c0_g2~~TRINITY_DN3752_c0_g2_i6.p1  ORF type:complete len:307 (+),score=44.21 TRINITY_DN3752_c0_g2_i6:38-958(+)
MAHQDKIRIKCILLPNKLKVKYLAFNKTDEELSIQLIKSIKQAYNDKSIKLHSYEDESGREKIIQKINDVEKAFNSYYKKQSNYPDILHTLKIYVISSSQKNKKERHLQKNESPMFLERKSGGKSSGESNKYNTTNNPLGLKIIIPNSTNKLSGSNNMDYLEFHHSSASPNSSGQKTPPIFSKSPLSSNSFNTSSSNVSIESPKTPQSALLKTSSNSTPPLTNSQTKRKNSSNSKKDNSKNKNSKNKNSNENSGKSKNNNSNTKKRSNSGSKNEKEQVIQFSPAIKKKTPKKKKKKKKKKKSIFFF